MVFPLPSLPSNIYWAPIMPKIVKVEKKAQSYMTDKYE